MTEIPTYTIVIADNFDGGNQMDIMEIFDELFPLNRCISGKGLRDSLKIITKYVPLTMTEYASGMACFDWEVPLEWNITEAYVMNKAGKRIIDFDENNLHVLAYCAPYEGWVSREELMDHIYTVEDMPDAIPYITSVYEPRWGFCVQHNRLTEFDEEEYYIKIDASFTEGSITLGEAFMKGESDKEILFFSHTGHPSMANDQLSGMLTLMLIYNKLSQLQGDHYYSYRFMFCPETIGTAAYLSENLSSLREKFHAGYTTTFIGDKSPVRYKQSLHKNSVGDLAAINAMNPEHVMNFTPYGSDERHFNAPGIDLPFGAFMRAGAYGYEEYHTSLDNKSVISEMSLDEAAEIVVEAVKNMEADRMIQPKHLGFEPKLDKLNLFPTLGKKFGHKMLAHQMLAIWRLCSEYPSLLEIANELNVKAHTLSEALDVAVKIGLVSAERKSS